MTIKLGRVRLREPRREGQSWSFALAEDSLPPEHPARLIWTLLGRFDLSRFTLDARVREGAAGRSLWTPRMLLTLWGYAFCRGFSSARHIARCIERDADFAWITGGESVSHRTLSGFLAHHREALEPLLTDVLTALLDARLLSLDRVSIDGVRVRASAGAGSFRSEPSLRECREQAALHLRAMLAQALDPGLSARERAARERGARETLARVEQALARAEQLERAQRESPDKRRHDKPARVSTTDCDARFLRCSNGNGVRPGYNVQLAVSGSEFGGPRTVVGVRVVATVDQGSLEPVRRQVHERTRRVPKVVLTDTGFRSYEDLRAAEAAGSTVLMPSEKRGPDPKSLRDPVVARWHHRMQPPDTQRLYRARSGLSEVANARMLEHFGLRAVRVRGIEKVTAVYLLAAVVHNLLAHGRRLLH